MDIRSTYPKTDFKSVVGVVLLNHLVKLTPGSYSATHPLQMVGTNILDKSDSVCEGP